MNISNRHFRGNCTLTIPSSKRKISGKKGKKKSHGKFHLIMSSFPKDSFILLPRLFEFYGGYNYLSVDDLQGIDRFNFNRKSTLENSNNANSSNSAANKASLAASQLSTSVWNKLKFRESNPHLRERSMTTAAHFLASPNLEPSNSPALLGLGMTSLLQKDALKLLTSPRRSLNRSESDSGLPETPIPAAILSPTPTIDDERKLPELPPPNLSTLHSFHGMARKSQKVEGSPSPSSTPLSIRQILSPIVSGREKKKDGRKRRSRENSIELMDDTPQSSRTNIMGQLSPRDIGIYTPSLSVGGASPQRMVSTPVVSPPPMDDERFERTKTHRLDFPSTISNSNCSTPEITPPAPLRPPPLSLGLGKGKGKRKGKGKGGRNTPPLSKKSGKRKMGRKRSPAITPEASPEPIKKEKWKGKGIRKSQKKGVKTQAKTKTKKKKNGRVRRGSVQEMISRFGGSSSSSGEGEDGGSVQKKKSTGAKKKKVKKGRKN